MFIHFSDSNRNYIYKTTHINNIVHLHGATSITIEFEAGDSEVFYFDSKDAAFDAYQYILNQLCGRGF